MTKLELIQEIKKLSLKERLAIESELHQMNEDNRKPLKVSFVQPENDNIVIESLQHDKMKQLWENEYDDIWNKI